MTTPTLGSSPWDVRPGPGNQARQLAADAAAAAELRAYRTDPDVVALRVEQIRTQVDYLMWVGIVLGLCFTMTNVQQFAAAGAPVGSLAWWSAWLLDPMVSLVLLAVLRAEQVTTRYQVSTGVWPRVAKWALLSATYVMNTWVSWAAGSASGVVLHTMAPRGRHRRGSRHRRPTGADPVRAPGSHHRSPRPAVNPSRTGDAGCSER